MPRLTVNIADLQRKLAGTQVLILHFQALQGVIQLSIDALTVFGDIRFTINVHAFQHGHLFTFNRNGNLINREFLIADTLFEVGHAAVAVCFQIVEGNLYLLIVFVNGVDQTALRFPCQGKHVPFAVSIYGEVATAEGDFLVLFLVVQRLQRDIRAGVTGIADAGINRERRFIFCQIEQRLS